MTRAQQLLEDVIYCFDECVSNYDLINAGYDNHKYSKQISNFKEMVKRGFDISFGKCYHANGIGNNNEYPLVIRHIDEDGFLTEKILGKFEYTIGVYGGVSAYITDNYGNVLMKRGRAR